MPGPRSAFPVTLLFAAVLASTALSGASAAQETEVPTSRQPATMVLREGEAERELPLPALAGPRGPLVALPAVLAQLGGTLRPMDPLNQGFELKVLDQVAVLGEGSSVVTLGQEIVPISQPPAILGETPYVPVDLLTRTYGQILGYVFRWNRSRSVLEVERRPARDIPMEVDVVHLQGVSTVVLQFAERPRYLVQDEPGRVRIDILGDRLLPRPIRAPERDPYLRGVEVSPQQIVLRIDAEAAADHYTLDGPFRLVFDVHRRNLPSTLPTPVAPTGKETSAPDRWTIVVDPGHGGSETGAIGPRGSAEKNLTLILARALRDHLEARLPVRVVLTRDEDADLPLETRTSLANQNRADLFVSLHLNASVGSSAHGAETYFLSLTATDEDAARTAELENLDQDAAEAEGDDEDLELILWDLAQSYHMTESQRLANLIQRELDEALGMRDRGVRQAPFKVLMGATMPAVLVELGFITNPEEEARLHDPAHREELVEALTRALIRFRSESTSASLFDGNDTP